MRLLRLITVSGDLSLFRGLPLLFGIFLVVYFQGSTRLARLFLSSAVINKHCANVLLRMLTF
jgi:hypothetical protein